MKQNDDIQTTNNMQASAGASANDATNTTAAGTGTAAGKIKVNWATDNTGTQVDTGKQRETASGVDGAKDTGGTSANNTATTGTMAQNTQSVAPENNGPKWVKPRNAYQAAYLAANPLPDKKQLEAEAKQLRRQTLWSSIGDGISALSNLYYTTKGAPSAYDAQSSLTAQLNKRRKQLEAVREANRQAWLKGYQQAQQNDLKDNYNNQRLSNDVWYKEAAAKNQRERAANTKAYQKAQVDIAKQRQASTDALNKEKMKTEGYRRQNYRAQANKANRWRPSNGRASGGKGYDLYVAGKFVGHYNNEKEWETAVYSQARKHNISSRNAESIYQARDVADIAGELANLPSGAVSDGK